MGERNQSRGKEDRDDDLFDAVVGDLLDDEFEEMEATEVMSDKAAFAAKRRRAERRLEALRLREELGDYDFDFDDDY